jgi:hypothetical protein
MPIKILPGSTVHEGDVGNIRFRCGNGADCQGSPYARAGIATLSVLTGLAALIAGFYFIHGARVPNSLPKLKPLSRPGRITLAVVLPVLGGLLMATPSAYSGVKYERREWGMGNVQTDIDVI